MLSYRAEERCDAVMHHSKINEEKGPCRLGDNQAKHFICDDGVVRAWSDLTEDLDLDSYPADEADEELLLWCFGAKVVER